MRKLAVPAVALLMVAGGGVLPGPARAQNGSQCVAVTPPSVPNKGVLAVAAGTTAGTVAVRCTLVASSARTHYWGARTSNAWDIVGTYKVGTQTVTRTIASGRSALQNDGMPDGGEFTSYANETIAVTIYGMCAASGVCGAEGFVGVGG